MNDLMIDNIVRALIQKLNSIWLEIVRFVKGNSAYTINVNVRHANIQDTWNITHYNWIATSICLKRNRLLDVLVYSHSPVLAQRRKVKVWIRYSPTLSVYVVLCEKVRKNNYQHCKVSTFVCNFQTFIHQINELLFFQTFFLPSLCQAVCITRNSEFVNI